MLGRRENSESLQGFDITPLIDIVFILLIFFMVSTTFVKDMNLDIDRPTAKSASPAGTQAIRLYIDEGGDTYLDGEPVQIWMIQGRLSDLLEVSTSDAVLVVTDDGVPAKRLIEVVDQARLAGAEVGVATRDEAGAS